MQDRGFAEIPLCIQYFKIRPCTVEGVPGFKAVWFDPRKADGRDAETDVVTVAFRTTRDGVRNSMARLFRDVREAGGTDA